MSTGAAGDYYEAETINVSGRVILERRWTGEISLETGLYLRDDERGAQVGVHGGVHRSLTRRWKVGFSAKVQDAPSIERGTDLSAYLTLRRLLVIGDVPVLATDLGIGASLDEPGVAWRLAFRLGPWPFAPVLQLDQALGGDARRTSLGFGIGLGF